MLFDHTKINVSVDTTTYCNARCPQCHRTNPDGLGKVDWLPLEQWSLEDFQNAFSPEDMVNIDTFTLVGTWGEVVMVKDIMQIVRYVIDNSDCKISLDTNGSLRDEDWWWEFGLVGGERFQVTFDIDGTNQDMHSLYRQGTDLDKVLTNMSTFAATRGSTRSQTILFEHNAEYTEYIRQLCIDNGSTLHTFITSDRFDHDNTMSFIDTNGNTQYLHRANNSVIPQGKISGLDTRYLSKDITCTWAAKNKVFITPDGAVLPCCFHSNGYYIYTKSGVSGDLVKSRHFQYYLNNRDRYNIFKRSLSDILQSDWFTDVLPGSMTSKDPIRVCERHCSSRADHAHQLREIRVVNL